MHIKFGRDLPRTTKDLNWQSQTDICGVFLILNYSITISHSLCYVARCRDFHEEATYNTLCLEFDCPPLRLCYVHNQGLIVTWSQGRLQDSGMFTEQGLITISSLMSTIQWELHRTENKQRHSHQNDFSLRYIAQGQEVQKSNTRAVLCSLLWGRTWCARHLSLNADLIEHHLLPSPKPWSR